MTLLILCQFAGEVVGRSVGPSIPGPVVGLVILLVILVVRDLRGARGPDPGLKATANGLLGHLSLLFVPAGVGVVTQLDILGQNWLSVTVAIIVSTALGLFVTGWIMHHLAPPEVATPDAG